LILTVKRVRSVLKQGLHKLRDIAQGIIFGLKCILKPSKLSKPQVIARITNINITHTNIDKTELADDLKGFFIKKHAAFGQNYCCTYSFDIERFSCLSNARCRDWIRDELITAYTDQGIKAITYLQRWAWSGLLVDVGNIIDSEVIPITEKDLTEAHKIRIRKKDRIVIAEPLAIGDDFLSQTINYLRDKIKANIFDIICLINVDIPNRQLPVNRSLLNLDLNVVPKSGCSLCGMTARLKYY
jgi:hypothetical protein